MSISVLIAGLGALLVLIGIVGGGLEAKELKVPPVSQAIRVIAVLAGLVFITIGIALEIRPDNLFFRPITEQVEPTPEPEPSVEEPSEPETSPDTPVESPDIQSDAPPEEPEASPEDAPSESPSE